MRHPFYVFRRLKGLVCLESQLESCQTRRMKPSSRRAFIRKSMVITAAAAIAEPASIFFPRARAAESTTRALRLGGPSYAGTTEPEALALAHRQLGYRA